MVRLYKLIISLFMVAFVGVNFAFAGDRALLDVIGYSKDARYFAFEEYGIQDGSGFAYSSIYIVDLGDDSWVTGTPIRVVANDIDEPIDFAKSLNGVRKSAHQKAQQRLDGLNIIWPARELAQNGDGEFENDGLSLKFGLLGYGLGAIKEKYEVSLGIYKTHSALSCRDYVGEDPMGFLLNVEQGGEIKQVYEDEVLARSRGCPITYKITSVFVPFEAVDISAAVAMISVYSFGYEGADRRFVAVPIGVEF